MLKLCSWRFFKLPLGNVLLNYWAEKKLVLDLSEIRHICPIIYIDDAVRATYDLMFANPKKMTVRCYNIAGYSVCPADFVI